MDVSLFVHYSKLLINMAAYKMNIETYYYKYHRLV